MEQYDRSLEGESQEWNSYTEVEHVLPRNITDWQSFLHMMKILMKLMSIYLAI